MMNYIEYSKRDQTKHEFAWMEQWQIRRTVYIQPNFFESKLPKKEKTKRVVIDWKPTQLGFCELRRRLERGVRARRTVN